MCGILGYIGGRSAPEVLIEGLRKLEYRGYDSAGVAVLTNGAIDLRRSVGKLSNLEALLSKQPLTGQMGLGHTRWATHGAPTEFNAHPHTDTTRKIVVVHNGIIENYQELKKKLQSKGFEFKSETDTEVVAHLIGSHLKSSSKNGKKTDKKDFVDAVLKSLKEIRGTYSLGIVCSSVPDLIVGARRDCPLIVGLGEKENFLASDVPAILSYTRNVIFLEEGDVALISGKEIEIFDEQGHLVKRKNTKITWNPIQAEKAGYKHFMLKEIYEQPRVVEDTLLERLNRTSGGVNLEEAGINKELAQKINRIQFLACGTSWHASLLGAFLIEKYTGIPCQAEIASEFRYRDPRLDPLSLIVAVSQSGETADTLAALKMAKKKGVKTIAITNVVGSTITREADGTLLTHCGPEIGVASTKAFMGQLVALQLINICLSQYRNAIPKKQIDDLGGNLVHLSQWITKTLEGEKIIKEIAKKTYKKTNYLFLGRNLNYPIALEGALKLKEISYIHAEGYPAGEMKHGPIALIDGNMPVVAIVTQSKVYEKMLSNIEEAKSRGAEVIAIATEGDSQVKEKAAHIIYVPEVPEDLSPLINVIPLQLLAYHIAVLRDCDVDQPRNLAKSVTVE